MTGLLRFSRVPFEKPAAEQMVFIAIGEGHLEDALAIHPVPGAAELQISPPPGKRLMPTHRPEIEASHDEPEVIVGHPADELGYLVAPPHSLSVRPRFLPGGCGIFGVGREQRCASVCIGCSPAVEVRSGTCPVPLDAQTSVSAPLRLYRASLFRSAQTRTTRPTTTTPPILSTPPPTPGVTPLSSS